MQGLARSAGLIDIGGLDLIRRIILGALAGAVLVSGTAFAHPMPAKTARAETYFAHRCGNSTVTAIKACLHRAALHWGQDYSDMVAISWRESRWNRYATLPCPVNPIAVGREHATGLMQFLPSTFASTPYAGRDICDPKWNALAAGWMWAHGRKREWSTA